MHVFPKKITKIYYIFGKNLENKCFRSKYKQFSAKVGQIFAFPTPGICLLSKGLPQDKIYIFFIVIRSSLKCIRKKPVRWIQKNLKTLIGTVTMSQVKLVNAIPLPWSEWFRSYFFTQHKTFSKITHQTAWTEAQPKQHHCFQSRSYKIWSC